MINWGIYHAFYDGGTVSPAAQSDILQWLIGLDPDAITLTDRKNIVNPEPELRDVNCLTSTGAQTISNANISNGAVVVNVGTADGTATAGVITFTSGTISQVSLDGVLTYVCEEGEDLPFDISGSGNDITSMTTTWTISDSLPSRNHLNGFRRPSDAYSTQTPDGGSLRTFNPNTDDIGKLFDLISTIIQDSRDSYGTYSITAPSGGLLRVIDPDGTIEDFYDVIATLATDLPSTASVYTITPPSVDTFSFNPNTDDVSVSMDVMATLMGDLQTYGIIG